MIRGRGCGRPFFLSKFEANHSIEWAGGLYESCLLLRRARREARAGHYTGRARSDRAPPEHAPGRPAEEQRDQESALARDARRARWAPSLLHNVRTRRDQFRTPPRYGGNTAIEFPMA